MNQIELLMNITAETNCKGEIPTELKQALAESLRDLADAMYNFADAIEKGVKKHGNFI